MAAIFVLAPCYSGTYRENQNGFQQLQYEALIIELQHLISFPFLSSYLLNYLLRLPIKEDAGVWEGVGIDIALYGYQKDVQTELA